MPNGRPHAQPVARSRISLNTREERISKMPSLLAIRPEVPAPLDPDFLPAVLANRSYREAVSQNGNGQPLLIALERENDLVRRADLVVFPKGSDHDEDTLKYVERHIKFLLWAEGGWRLLLSGPRSYVARLHRCTAQVEAAPSTLT